MAIFPASAIPAGATGFDIDNSLRFNDDDSAYLSRTPSSAGNRKTWTWSGWVKRGNLGTQQTLLHGGADNTSHVEVYFNSGTYGTQDSLFVSLNPSGASYVEASTFRVFRDTSAWYHIVVAFDTTQATDTDRFKLYVNGGLINPSDFTHHWSSSWSGVAQDSEWHFNNSSYPIRHGSALTNDAYLDGHLAEVHFIDGQSFFSDTSGTASTTFNIDSFGETGDYGEWKAKKVSGLTYGTNGFYLDFKTSGTLGNDANGSNNWTTNNLASTDQMVDTPTNNFCTLNPLDANASIAISEGNTKTTHSGWQEACATFWMTTGKYYYEATLENSAGTTGSNAAIFGIVKGSKYGQSHSVIDSGRMATQSNGTWVTEGLGTAADFTGSAVTYTTGDIMSLTFDADSGELKIYKNNSLVGTSSSTSEYATATEGWKIFLGGASGNRWVANFGQDSSFAGNKTAQGNQDGGGIGDFYYTPPSGFLALCTKNLPDPAVIPSEHFNTVTYTGNGSSSRSLTGFGFAPNWSWLMTRSTSGNHVLFDTVRGAGKRLRTNGNYAEDTGAGYGLVTSFNSDGITIDSGSNVNTNGQTYVAWNWKANGTGGTGHTQGTISSTASVNSDAGFSIVKWSGNGSASLQTIGHGLSKTPEMIIRKRTDDANYWYVYHTGLTSNLYEVYLNDTNAQTSGGFFQRGMPNATTFTAYDGGETYHRNITYCFHSVEGYSKVGSYTGNGNADGTFVYTGFRPAYVLFKPSSISGHGWNIHDTTRDTTNPQGDYLQANSSSAEGDFGHLDIVSNGFKLRTHEANANGSGNTYIFIAFAESPFKHTNAR